MRTIEYTSQFKRDYRRVKAGQLGPKLEELMQPILSALCEDRALPERCRDHALTGEWKDFRDCHVRPDLILIYRKSDETVTLVRLGSHSELGL